MSLQAEHWNGPGGERWASSQADIDRSMSNINDLLMSWVDVKSGDRVLDVGCGTGSTSIALAARGAIVHGVDISAPMLGLAKRRAPEIEFTLADAMTHAFERRYDVVFSRFGVMFFDDPVAAFANLKTALAPDGRLAFVCWQALAENPWAAMPLQIANDLLPKTDPPDPEAPGPFAFAKRERLALILSSAGFTDISIEPRSSTMVLGETLDAAVESALTFGPLSRAASGLPDDTIAQLRTRLLAQMQPALPASVWLVAAR